MVSGLNWIDYSVVIGYIFLVIGVGIAGSLYQKAKASRLGEEGGFFLAGRSLPWFVVGLSLFSTNISTVHIVGLAEAGYKYGLVNANYELGAGFILIILAIVFVPFYLSSKVTTLPDFMEKRYGKGSRNFLALISIISALFIHIGVSLYAGSLVINTLLGIQSTFLALLLTSITIAMISGLYTAIGGLFSVAITDMLQTVTLITGSAVVTILAYRALGGWNELQTTVGPQMMSLLRPKGDPSGLPWYSFLLGYPVIGIWYWCTDQTIVQRVLGAKSEKQGKAGAIFAGFVKLLPLFIFVLPGLIGLALVMQGKMKAPANSASIYADMVLTLLPAGAKGLIAAALMAALMGTVAGALNSTATLFTYDLYHQLKPHADQAHLVRLGRVVTLIGIIVSVLWSLCIGFLFETIFDAIVTMISYVAPPITAVFLVGLFWKRANKLSAFITLVVGSITGVFFFTLQLLGLKMNYLVVSFLICMSLIILQVLVSLLSKPDNNPEVENLVWKNPLEPFKFKKGEGILNAKVLSLGLISILVLVYFIFRAPSFEKLKQWKNDNPQNSQFIENHTAPLGDH